MFALLPERVAVLRRVGVTSPHVPPSRLNNERGPIVSIEPKPLHAADVRVVRRLIDGFDLFMLLRRARPAGALTLYASILNGIH